MKNLTTSWCYADRNTRIERSFIFTVRCEKRSVHLVIKQVRWACLAGDSFAVFSSSSSSFANLVSTRRDWIIQHVLYLSIFYPKDDFRRNSSAVWIETKYRGVIVFLFFRQKDREREKNIRFMQQLDIQISQSNMSIWTRWKVFFLLNVSLSLSIYLARITQRRNH